MRTVILAFETRDDDIDRVVLCVYDLQRVTVHSVSSPQAASARSVARSVLAKVRLSMQYGCAVHR